MAANSTAELTLAEECYARAVEAGLTKTELAGLKRILARRSDVEILRAISQLSKVSGYSVDQAVGLLYSLTDSQLSELEWSLKTSAGWD